MSTTPKATFARMPPRIRLTARMSTGGGRRWLKESKNSQPEVLSMNVIHDGYEYVIGVHKGLCFSYDSFGQNVTRLYITSDGFASKHLLDLLAHSLSPLRLPKCYFFSVASDYWQIEAYGKFRLYLGAITGQNVMKYGSFLEFAVTNAVISKKVKKAKNYFDFRKSGYRILNSRAENTLG